MTAPVKVPLTSIYDDLKTVADTISTQIRTIAVGVLAVVWLLLTRGDQAPVLSKQPDRTLLLVCAVLCIVTLVADYLQYFFGYSNSRAVLKAAEDQGHTETSYNYTAVRYVLRTVFFWIKQLLAMAAVVVLLLVLLPEFL
jgi:hypothetical protein